MGNAPADYQAAAALAEALDSYASGLSGIQVVEVSANRLSFTVNGVEFHAAVTAA